MFAALIKFCLIKHSFLLFNLVKMRDEKSFYCCKKKKKKNPNQNEFKLLSTTGALHQVLHYDRFHFHSSSLFPALHNCRLVFLLLESHFSRWVEVSDRSFGLSQVSGGGRIAFCSCLALLGQCRWKTAPQTPASYCFDKWISAVITSDRR